MRTIWKFSIKIADEQKISVPFNSRLLYAGLDPTGAPCVWANVETENSDKEEHTVHIRGTGHPLPNYGHYLNSFNHGPFVWHVFTHE